MLYALNSSPVEFKFISQYKWNSAGDGRWYPYRTTGFFISSRVQLTRLCPRNPSPGLRANLVAVPLPSAQLLQYNRSMPSSTHNLCVWLQLEIVFLTCTTMFKSLGRHCVSATRLRPTPPRDRNSSQDYTNTNISQMSNSYISGLIPRAIRFQPLLARLKPPSLHQITRSIVAVAN